MSLKEYIDSFPVEERVSVRQKLAKAAGVTESCIKHYAIGRRKCPAARAVKIEVATDGKVTAHQIVFGTPIPKA
uniref:YdaS family helix-turn-helix protein n=1 Tax=Marinobacterium profundum TaxID=1714300 RepID=UPI000AE38FF7|nr:YdaS family helix-turn-helix protein [Marinobacterium profundum]